jgi:hypothetical protein
LIAVRHGIALAGFLVGAAGTLLDHRGLVWIAIGLLGVALLLRVIKGFRERRPSPPDSVSPSRDD